MRKIVSTILIATMIFFAPSLIPLRRALATGAPCGVPFVWLPMDTAYAVQIIPCPPIPVKPIPAWWWVAFACPASIILSGMVANFRDHRELTTAEAWTCGLLYWIPMPPQQPVHHHHH